MEAAFKDTFREKYNLVLILLCLAAEALWNRQVKARLDSRYHPKKTSQKEGRTR